MEIRNLIELLEGLERDHGNGRTIEVEIRDQYGFPTKDFRVQFQVFFAKPDKANVRFVPIDKAD